MLNFTEFKSYIKWCESLLLGAQLQDVWTNDHQLVLEFYKFRPLWLVVDLVLSHPQIVLLQQRSPSRGKKKKPVGLFIASHGRNQRVKALKSVLRLGRVAELELGSLVEAEASSCLVEIQVVPRSPNIIVTAKGKSLSWIKPQELTIVQDAELEELQGREEEWLQREQDWFEAQRASPQATAVDTGKILAKKEKALVSLQESLQSEESLRLRQYGETLAAHQPIPEELKKYSALSIVQAFDKAKLLEKKKSGTEDRIKKLEFEIESLRSGKSKPEAKGSRGSKLMHKADAKGRKLELGPQLEAICGKSAKDNLAILRQARAWDLWMHLRDYPGAHGIIFREKSKIVDQVTLQRVAEWIIEESPAAKGFAWGAKYDIVVAECRHVRPLKGDQLGRVTYHNPTVYTFASKKK